MLTESPKKLQIALFTTLLTFLLSNSGCYKDSKLPEQIIRPEQPSQKVRWQYNIPITTILVDSVAVTKNARRVAASSSTTGLLYYLDENGGLIWRKGLSAPILKVEVEADGNFIACLDAKGNLHVVDKEGKIAWSQNLSFVDLSSAATSFQSHLAISISPDAKRVAAIVPVADSQGEIEGSKLAVFTAKGKQTAGFLITPDCKMIGFLSDNNSLVVASSAGPLGLYDYRGSHLADCSIDAKNIIGLNIVGDQSAVIDLAKADSGIELNAFDTQNKKLWTKRIDVAGPDKVIVAPDMRIAALSYLSNETEKKSYIRVVSIKDNKKRILTSESKPQSMAFSSNGDSLIVGGSDGKVVVYDLSDFK